MLQCFWSDETRFPSLNSLASIVELASQVSSNLHLVLQRTSSEITPLELAFSPYPASERACVRMTDTPIIMHEQQFQQLRHILNKLRLDSFSRVVFLVDKNGQQIAALGDIAELDTTSLASLAAGNVAATGGMAQLIGEKEFPTLSHEGERDSIHICIIGRVLLVVVFDDRSSLGLIKLRVKQASRDLALLFDELERLAAQHRDSEESLFAEITDDDIDSLFN